MNETSTTIESAANPSIKRIRKLSQRKVRDETGLFVAEGEDLIAEAAAADWRPVELYSAQGSKLDGTPVDPDLLTSVSTLASGTRTIGVYEQKISAPVGPLCVYLHGVGDPGHVGTILRSALAFGAGSVVLGPNSADPFSPKAVRASMGAIFRVPVSRADFDDLPGAKVAMVAGASEPIAGVQLDEVTIVIGEERSGLPDDVVSKCDRVAQIPIAFESLNVAMATTVALYELSRTRIGS